MAHPRQRSPDHPWRRCRHRRSVANIEVVLQTLAESDTTVRNLQTEVDQRDEWLALAGAFIQIFEFQIEFLRRVNAGDEISGAAAEEWFAVQLRASTDAGATWDFPALVGWLVNVDLLRMNERGVYSITDKGSTLIALADSFWYVPKIV